LPTSFALNPDYVLNHPKAMYPGLPPGHTNRLLLSNTDAVIYPQRRHTPPPDPIWHETSFIEDNWSVLANVVIRYYLRNSKDIRDARIQVKSNGQGFWMQARASRIDTPESKWKWQEITHTELTPLTPCHQNKDWPWIIISGNQDVGRYCKALNCPRYLEDAETTELWFTVALARIELQDGRQVVHIDEPRQVRRIRQGDLAVVFRTREERKNDPFIYEGTKNSVAKRKRAEELEGEEAAAKKQKTGDVDVNNIVAAAAANLWDYLRILANGASPNQKDPVDGTTQAQAIDEVEVAVVTEGFAAEKRGIDETEACGVEVVDGMDAEHIADNNTEGSEMEVHGMDPDNVVANSK
jgi:hypothetical protein